MTALYATIPCTDDGAGVGGGGAHRASSSPSPRMDPSDGPGSAPPTLVDIHSSSNSSPQYVALQSLIQRYSGRCGPVEMPLMPYEYTGLDYSIVLLAVLPRNVMAAQELCWVAHPADSQLLDNLRLFVNAAVRLSDGGLPDVPLRSLSVDRLTRDCRNVVHHVSVQLWLAHLVERYGVTPEFDPFQLRRSMMVPPGEGDRGGDVVAMPRTCVVSSTVDTEQGEALERLDALTAALYRAKEVVLDGLADGGGTLEFNAVLSAVRGP